MDQRTCRRPVHTLGTFVCLSGAILLVCLPHLARCGAAHPVITSPKSSLIQQANTLTQQQQNQASSNQMHLLGRSQPHHSYSSSSSSSQTASSQPHRPGQPNLPALSTPNSYAFEDQLANVQHQQQAASILTRSSQKIQPINTQSYRIPAPTSSIGSSSHPNLVMASNQAQFNNMLNPYTNATHILLLDLRQQLITRALKFDEQFRDLLSKSKVGLHNMFVDTYGLIYELNVEIFTNMYEDLTQYYATGQIKLTESMNNFFISLYQKIFQVYNSNKSFSGSYLECATQQLVVLKPFKDAPDKLISDIRHVFVAARTLNQALNAGIELIKSIISLGTPTQCTSMTNDKLLRQVEAGKPPCLGFCSEVITRCIGRNNLETLSNSWKSYVSSLSELAKMLSGRYNIANIITPIDVQISEAIMNFQENAQNISQAVFEACSKDPKAATPSALVPPHNRLTRRAAPATLNSMKLNSARRNVNQQPAAANEHQFKESLGGGGRASVQSNMKPSDFGSTFLGGMSVERPLAIIDEIRTYVVSTRGFWSNLPNAVCTSNQTLSLAHAANNNNNNPTASYASRKNPPSNCFSENLAIWDMNSDMRFTLEINQIIERFKTMELKIRDALAGREIDWSTSSPQNNQRIPQTNLTDAQPPAYVRYPTTTTISTQPEDESEDQTEDSSFEEGSGEEPDESDDPVEGEDADDQDPEDPSTLTDETSAPPDFPAERDDPSKDNRIDAKPASNDLSVDQPFITVDPSPRKSGAVSLVILEYQLRPLLVSLFSLGALSVVNIFQANHHYQHFSFGMRTLLASL